MHNKIIELQNFRYCFCFPLLVSAFVCLFCFFCYFLFLAFLFHLLFSLFLALIIGIFYCLNWILLLLHLITTHLVSHLSHSSIVFITFALIISTHLLLSYLHFAITSSLYNTTCNGFYNNYLINIWPRQLFWFI